jgi:hypothetical protein
MKAGVNAALANADGPGPATRLADSGGQGNGLAPDTGGSGRLERPDGRWRRIWRAPLPSKATPVKPARPTRRCRARRGRPAVSPLAAPDQGLALAWEDRRHGHTVIYGTRSGTASLVHPHPRERQPYRQGPGRPGPRHRRHAPGPGGLRRPARGRLAGQAGFPLRLRRLRRPERRRRRALRQGREGPGQLRRRHRPMACGGGGQPARRSGHRLRRRAGRHGGYLADAAHASGHGENFTLPAASGPGRQSDPAIALDERATCIWPGSTGGCACATPSRRRRATATWPRRRKGGAETFRRRTGRRPQAANSGSSRKGDRLIRVLVVLRPCSGRAGFRCLHRSLKPASRSRLSTMPRRSKGCSSLQTGWPWWETSGRRR